MRHRLRVPVLFTAAALVLSVSTVSAAGPVDEERLEAGVAERQHYGLPADEATVRSIIATGQDVGSERWGIVLTAAEDEMLDLPGRGDHVASVGTLVLDHIRSSDDYAGAYVDQTAGGSVVVLLTRRDPAALQLIDSARAALDRGLEVRFVTASLRDLEAAMFRVWDVWPEHVGDGEPVTVSVDEFANTIVVGVQSADLVLANQSATALANDIGVNVVIEARDQLTDLCSSRTNCPPPMKAGISVFRGGNPPNHQAQCSMGFHIFTSTGQGRFVTAGHCGWTGSDNWYNPGTSLSIGWQTVWQYGPGFSPSRDIMAVHMPTSWMTNRLYGSSLQVKSTAHPVLNETICASLGVSSDPYDCGHVSDTSHTWTSNTCSCVQHGAVAAGVTNTGGDSGSPMIGLGTYARATGLLAQGNNLVDGTVYFTRFRDAMNTWGYTLKTS